MERTPLVRRRVWVGLSAFILVAVVIILMAQGQANVTMTITGTVRWGEPGGQSTPEGYSKGAPIQGISAIAFLVKGTDVHGMPITEILAETKTDEKGVYTLTFSVSAAEKYVGLKAISSWGEGQRSVPVSAGTFTVDLLVDFGHRDYSPPTVAWYDIVVLQIGASKLVLWHATLLLAFVISVSIILTVRRQRRT